MTATENAKEAVDRLLSQLGTSLAVADFRTDAKGLARLSVPGVGMLDFELYDEQRSLGIFVNVGAVPDDVSDLLRIPLEHSEMAGFWFSLDGFRSQVYLTTTIVIDGITDESFKNIYDRFVQCASYWLTSLPSVNREASDAPASSGAVLAPGAFIA